MKSLAKHFFDCMELFYKHFFVSLGSAFSFKRYNYSSIGLQSFRVSFDWSHDKPWKFRLHCKANTKVLRLNNWRKKSNFFLFILFQFASPRTLCKIQRFQLAVRIILNRSKLFTSIQFVTQFFTCTRVLKRHLIAGLVIFKPP